jgi:hypothetical protein
MDVELHPVARVHFLTELWPLSTLRPCSSSLPPTSPVAVPPAPIHGLKACISLTKLLVSTIALEKRLSVKLARLRPHG